MYFMVEMGHFKLNMRIMAVGTFEQKKTVLYYMHQREHRIHFPETLPPPQFRGGENKPATLPATKSSRLLNNITHRDNSFLQNMKSIL